MNNLPVMSRVTRSRKQAIVAYDQMSKWYDWLSAGSEEPITNLGLKKLNAGAGETILEVGFGTGHALIELNRSVDEAGRVIGIDISHGMLKMARERIMLNNQPSHIMLGQADAVNLPFATNSFHAVFMSFTLELFDTPEISMVLDECRRVLRPDGRICVVALARDEYEGISLSIYEWFHRRFPALLDCRPIQARLLLELMGFQILDITRKWMWGLPVEICLAQSS
jgi:ubiquinone/menaquinone biosynthesis C-methylase UbiE